MNVATNTVVIAAELVGATLVLFGHGPSSGS